MDLVQILLLLTAIIGIFLMVFTLVKLKIEDDKPSDSYFETGNSIKAINSSLDEAEKAVEELNKFAQSVLTDIDTKYQELLFVYNLIDEKKSELKGYGGRGGAGGDTVKVLPFTKRTDSIVSETLAGISRKRDASLASTSAAGVRPTTRKADIHPKHREIVSLHESGMSVTDISKKLDMGQGEVKLILELAKAR